MTTKLEAVNTMLRVIGQVPVLSIPDSGISDAAVASAVLDEYTKELQSTGYDFNTDTEKELTPNVDGFILIPDNVIRVDISRCYRVRNIVFRPTSEGRRLYDQDDNTFVFDDDAKVIVDWVFTQDFEYLPETLQRYVIIRSARVFANRVVGAGEINAYTNEDEIMAKTAWLEEVSADEDLNMFNRDGFKPRTFHPIDAINRNGY